MALIDKSTNLSRLSIKFHKSLYGEIFFGGVKYEGVQDGLKVMSCRKNHDSSRKNIQIAWKAWK